MNQQIDNILSGRPDPGADPARGLPGAPPQPGPAAVTDKGVRPFEGTEMTIGNLGKYLAEHDQAVADLGRIPGEAAQFARTARDELGSVAGKVTAAIQAAERLHADDRIYPEGRQRLLAEQTDTSEAAIKAAAAKIAANAQQAQAELFVAAMPTMPKGQEVTARQDAMMILDRAQPNDRPRVLRELASRDDAIGALAASSWGRDYLQASGMSGKEVAQFHGFARDAAVSAAESSTDPARAAAARHYRHIGDLADLAGVAGTLARHASTEMRKRYGLPDTSRTVPNAAAMRRR